jgi:hypothetical protein
MAIEPFNAEAVVSSRRLWFGFVTAALAWLSLGCLDILVTWRACMHQEQYGIPNSPPDVSILFDLLSFVLLALTVTAGITSYGNWRRLSSQREMLKTDAVERREFMALLGVIVSVTLGMGMVWLALPPLFLDLCWRAR